MNEYETLYLDGLLLPNYNEFIELTKPNVAKNITLDGSLYIDFYNNRRSWRLSWTLLTMAEYEAIKAKYDKQFSDQVFLSFNMPDHALTTLCYVNVNDKNIKYNGQYVEGFSIVLEEQYAIS